MPQRPEDIPPHWTVRSIIDALKIAKPYLRERYRVREIGVFGSYVQSEQGMGSDLDILVELDEPIGWDVVDLKEDLERILGLPVNYPPLTQGASCFIPLPIESGSTGSSARSAPASANCLILVAAFRSRSWCVPQSGQVHSRSLRVRSAFR